MKSFSPYIVPRLLATLLGVGAVKRWYRRAAEQGDAKAQTILGDGYALENEYAEAVKWHRLAAEQGHPWAQNHLGNAYYHGKVVEQNRQEAAKWYRRSADQGNAWAQTKIGLGYMLGIGVVASDIEAYFWLKLAAAHGDEKVGQVKKELGKLMTAEQIAEAETKAAEWQAKPENP